MLFASSVAELELLVRLTCFGVPNLVLPPALAPGFWMFLGVLPALGFGCCFGLFRF